MFSFFSSICYSFFLFYPFFRHFFLSYIFLFSPSLFVSSISLHLHFFFIPLSIFIYFLPLPFLTALSYFLSFFSRPLLFFSCLLFQYLSIKLPCSLSIFAHVYPTPPLSEMTVNWWILVVRWRYSLHLPHSRRHLSPVRDHQDIRWMRPDTFLGNEKKANHISKMIWGWMLLGWSLATESRK